MKFLENEPLVELKKSHNIPWLLGVNADEGSIAALGWAESNFFMLSNNKLLN